MLGVLDRRSSASKSITGGAPKMASAGRAGWAMLKKWLEAVITGTFGPRLSNVSVAFCRKL